MKNELIELAAKEEEIGYKKLSQEMFSDGFKFLWRYGMPYTFLKGVTANKISINTANDDTANDDQNKLVFNLIKGYGVSSFFKKKMKLEI